MKIHSTTCLLSSSQCYLHICQLWPWPLTLKIKRVHPLIIGNTWTKFDENTLKLFISIMFAMLLSFSPFWSWLLNSKFDRAHPLIMVDVSAKFDEGAFTSFMCDRHRDRLTEGTTKTLLNPLCNTLHSDNKTVSSTLSMYDTHLFPSFPQVIVTLLQ